MKIRPFLAAACLFPTVHAEPAAVEAKPDAAVVEQAEEAPQFIRVEETEGATRLETALVHLRKGDVTVDLVGAIHIADKKYYEALNQRFEGYEALLYEGIGSPKPAAVPEAEAEPEPPPADEPAGPAPAAKAKGKLNGLHAAYESGAKWLGLSYQMKEIDYRKANFVHADVSFEEFTALQAGRKESLVSFVLKAGLQPQPANAKEPSTLKLLTSLVRGDKNGLKRELVHTLGQGDDQVAALAGDNVIVGDRNAKCLQVLDREVLAGKKKLGIFYGAAHFPDMERRLLEAGWQKTGTEWMAAWDIGK